MAQTFEDGESKESIREKLNGNADELNLVSSRVKKTTITHEQLLAFATPVTLVPAESGKVNIPIQILFSYVDNSGWGNSGSPWTVKLGIQTVASFSTSIGSGSTLQQIIVLGSALNTGSGFENTAITITGNNNMASPADPTTTLDIYVIYNQITL